MATEKRLIDALALMRKVQMKPGLSAKAYKIIQTLIENAPTVDAVEVVHGRCEYCKDGKSFIGARMLLGNDGKWHDINNCPNCGAKMDGGVKNE